MDKLYLLCMVLCVVSIVCMTVLIFLGVISRYFFEVGARFAEPMSIFFTVQLTMYGSAICYRSQAHLRLEVFVRMLPERLQLLPQYVVHALMFVIERVFYHDMLVELEGEEMRHAMELAEQEASKFDL